MMRKIFFAIFVMVIWSGIGGHAGGASVEMFSPEGTVKDVRQVTARFTDQMAAFGDPRLVDPFTVQCAQKGQGRWIDGKNWSYDFAGALPAGVACTFTLKQNLKTLSGTPVAGRKTFTFDTGGPSVRESDPWAEGNEIEERQTFLFRLDAPATEASVAKNVSCSIERIRERVGIRLITGEERRRLLRDMGVPKKAENHAVLFQCRQAFPPKALVKIIWGRGVRSKSGVATVKDQVLSYRARGPFTARFRCMKEKPRGGCIPLSPMRLIFSAPISKKDAAKVTMATQKNSTKAMAWKPGIDNEGDSDTTYLIFRGPFPEKSLLNIHLPEGLKDVSGRSLSNASKFPLPVKTDTYPALAKFPDRFGVIESKKEAFLPVTVRNIEAEVKTWLLRGDEERVLGPAAPQGRVQGDEAKPAVGGMKGSIRRTTDDDASIIAWLYKLDSSPRERSVLKGDPNSRAISIPRPGGTQEFEVIGIPLREPGFYVVEIESLMLGQRLLDKPGPLYVPTSALVTNMAAHLKWGRESSLVFVTALDSGDPVANASVTLRDCRGGLVWQGTADANGIARIAKRLPDQASLPQCRRGKEEKGLYYEYSRVLSGITGGLFVFARSGRDMTFTHSSWDDGIESWRFNLPERYGSRKEPIIAHTVFDRTLLRAGETVHMKHFVRQRTMEGLFVPSSLRNINEAVVVHVGSNEKYTIGLTWKGNGTAENTWKIPVAAKLGAYEVYLRNAPAPGKREQMGELSGSFRVEQFRVPLMRGFIRGPKEPAINADSIDVDVDLRYLSGGAAADHPIRIRSEMEQKWISFDDYEDLTFSLGRVRTGMEKFNETADRFFEDEAPEGEETAEGSDRRVRMDRFGRPRVRLKTIELNLDRNGTARSTLKDLPRTDVPREILSELEFRDPNGEVQTASTRIPLYPSALHTGIAARGENVDNTLKYQVVVLDLKGNPQPDCAVKAKVFKRSTYSHRRRITGGFYAFEHATETKEIGEHCSGRTDANGILRCEGKTPATGRIVIEAQTKDSRGNVSSTNREVTVYGKDDAWHEARNDDRIELIPRRRLVDPGETMSFEVRMPFRTATALVTVEREGVMDAYIKKVSRENPVIDIPVKSNYVPNVFVSALVVRGRLAGTQPTALFDPGKPAYRLGIAEVRVGWKPHVLKVKVETDRKTYAVRQPVKAHIAVRAPDGSAPPSGSEVAVAVVDEGLLELKPNLSWGLLEAMMRRKDYEVSTATSQMMVVGKRHFGRKALPHGGGGGKQLTRELFDTLVYWRSAVPLDGDGEADVTFDLNDSLTSFRVVAIASSGSDLFGTGAGTIRTTQDLMLLSGLPGLVREGDRFTAGFTVRNASARQMDVAVSLKLNDGKSQRSLPPLSVAIPAGGAREANWQITVPNGVVRLDYEVSAKEPSGPAQDTLKATQKVVPAVSLRVFQGTLAQVKDTLKMDVEHPVDAQPGRGGVAVALRARLSEGLDGVVDHMRRYPYTCLEQKASKAVALGDREMWKDIMGQFPAYLDSDGLAKYFPLMMRGSDVLTSYLLSISSESGYEIPQNVRTKMIRGLRGFVEGKVLRHSSLQTADLSIRKVAAIAALARYGEANAQFLTTMDIEPNLWPTSAVLDWIDVLRRMAGIPDRDKKLEMAVRILRGRLNLQGTTMGISTDRSDQLWWLMVSTDLNCARTLIASMEFAAWREDVPRIARGLVSRMKRGRWDTTSANAWGVLAMERFSRKYESTPVKGVSSVALGQKQDAVRWADNAKGGSVILPWPERKSVLRIDHRGEGRPWASVQSIAAVPLKAPLASGYTIKKTITAVERKVPGTWTRGDVMRVRLEIDARSDMTWVVVSDPIPSGSAILGSGLGQGSALLSRQGLKRGWAWEAYRERSFEALRVYYEFVPQGKWTVEYSVRLNNDGMFHMPETRVEALYAPEMFGEIPNRPVEVRK
ncbi:MAG: MG2 domain-containing protein [Syntrophorhabdaceae bacterium]|nr:MG2 domain-containing protein [Syntrophorhabdaceae bacterium]